MKDPNPCGYCDVDVSDWRACKGCTKYVTWRKNLKLIISMEEVRATK